MIRFDRLGTMNLLALLGIVAAGCAAKGSASGDSGVEQHASGGADQATGGQGAGSGTGGSSSEGGGPGPGTGGSSSEGGGPGSGTGGNPASGGAPGTGGTTGQGGAAATTGTGGAAGVGGSLQGAGGLKGTAGSAGGNGGAVGTPGFRIVGRTAPGTSGGTLFEWSGSNVKARFMGTQLSAQMNDGTNGNSFEIVVDGGAPKKIFTASGQTTYQLATGLTSGVHDVVLWRDTEASFGPTEFIGFTGFGTGGALLPPAPAPGRLIELVGDSFSCGAGIEGGGTAGCASPIKIENHYLSYGAIAAREAGADLVTIAWSGIGVYRNYGTTTPTPTTVMPARYDYSIPTTQTPWDFSKYQPDVVIMNLNNNDFSTGDPGQPYITAYLKLTNHIRSNYPNAQFIHVIEWKTGSTTDQSAETAITTIVSMLKAGGDTKHAIFDMRPYANTNECGGHPDMAASQAMGDALAAELKSVLGW